MDVSLNQLRHHVATVREKGDRYALDVIEFSDKGAVSTDGRRMLLVEHDDQVPDTWPVPACMIPTSEPVAIGAGLCEVVAKVLSMIHDSGRGQGEHKAVIGRNVGPDGKPGPEVVLGIRHALVGQAVVYDQPDLKPAPWEQVMADSSGAFGGIYDLGLLIDTLSKLKGASGRDCVTIRLVHEPGGLPRSDGKTSTMPGTRLHLAAIGAQAVVMGIDQSDSPAVPDKLSRDETYAAKDMNPGSMFWTADLGRCVVLDSRDAADLEDLEAVPAIRLKDGRTIEVPKTCQVHPMRIGGGHGS